MGGLFRDSRGNPSWTVTLAIPAVLLVTLKYVFSGLTLFGIVIAPVSGLDYMTALGPWLAFFAQREFVEKSNGNGH